MAIEVPYELSPLGQKADLLAGGTGRPEGTHLVAYGDPEFAQAVELAQIRADGTGTISLPWRVHMKYDAPPSVARVLADIAEYRAAEQARKQAEHEAKIQRILTEPMETFLKERGNETWHVAAILEEEEDPRVADLRAIARAAASVKTREACEAKEARAKALADAKVLLAKELAALDQARALLEEVWQAIPEEEDDWDDAVQYDVPVPGSYLKRLRAFL